METVEELVDKLYDTILKCCKVPRNKYDLPRLELHYNFGAKCWQVFVVHNGERAVSPELFYETHTSLQEGLKKNITYFERFVK